MKNYTITCDHCDKIKDQTSQEFFGEGGDESVDGTHMCGACRKRLGKDKKTSGTMGV